MHLHVAQINGQIAISNNSENVFVVQQQQQQQNTFLIRIFTADVIKWNEKFVYCGRNDIAIYISPDRCASLALPGYMH